jgi:hypothetical protein
MELIAVPPKEETRVVVQLSLLLSIASLHARAGEYLGPN